MDPGHVWRRLRIGAKMSAHAMMGHVCSTAFPRGPRSRPACLDAGTPSRNARYIRLGRVNSEPHPHVDQCRAGSFRQAGRARGTQQSGMARRPGSGPGDFHRSGALHLAVVVAVQSGAWKSGSHLELRCSPCFRHAANPRRPRLASGTCDSFDRNARAPIRTPVERFRRPARLH